METETATNEISARRYVLIGAIVVLCLPSVVFLVAALAGGMTFSDTASAYAEQTVAQRTNLVVVSAMGVIPILLLGIAVWITSKVARIADKRRQFAIAGSLAIVLVILWANCEFWFNFLPGRMFLGFPHGLEFVIGPLIFAPIAMLVAMLIAAFLPAARQ